MQLFISSCYDLSKLSLTSEVTYERHSSHLYSALQDAEVAGTIKIANAFGAEISVRGGGHGYTCQGSKLGSVMLDMRKLKSIVFNKANSTNDIVSMTIGTGLTWGEVLKKLRDLDSDLLTVHGQCTSVGVAGYALHGGVHFGGLSELYGLASDNILALTAVVANGSTVVLSGTTCVIDGISREYSSACSGLWFAFRGAGSSFGVVTSLTLRLHREPRLLSALSILSLKIQNSSRSQRAIKSYMDSIPKEGKNVLDLFPDSTSNSNLDMPYEYQQ
jgi:FAD/FMN-containing dehydrogenase